MNELNIQTSDSINPFSSNGNNKELSEKNYSDPLYEEKYRLYTIFTADIVWTINKDGLVSYVNPFVENCIGTEVGVVIKNIASNFLNPVSVLSCLIELEEINSIVKSEYKMKPRKLFLETLMFEGKIRKLEITISATYDSMNNFIGFTGTCFEID